MRTTLRIISPMELLLAGTVWAGMLCALAFGAGDGDGEAPAQGPQAPIVPQAPDGAQANGQPWDERTAMWNSPPMLSARAWLEEYFRTSRQASPEQEQAYMQRLSELSAEEMRNWLKQMSQMRGRLFQQQQSLSATRQISNQHAAQKTTRTQPPRRGSAALPTPSRAFAQPNYVQPQSARRASELALQRDRHLPLPSFQILHFLDTLDLRDDVRELRRQAGQ